MIYVLIFIIIQIRKYKMNINKIMGGFLSLNKNYKK